MRRTGPAPLLCLLLFLPALPALGSPTPPKVWTRSPDIDETDVPRLSRLEAVVHDDEEGVDLATAALSARIGAAPVPGTLDVTPVRTGARIGFTPASALPPNVIVTLSVSISNTAGQPLTQSWTVRTADDPARAPVATAPSVGLVYTDFLEVNWSTDAPAAGRVEYGPTPALGKSVGTPFRVLEHTLVIPDLPAGTPCFFRAVSEDAIGHVVLSEVQSASTLAADPAQRAGRTLFVSQRHPAASDANPGTADLPWRTIGRAVQAAGPGDTVLVGDGQYAERISTAGRHGLPGAPVVFRADGSDVLIGEAYGLDETRFVPVPGHPDVYRLDLAGFPADLSRITAVVQQRFAPVLVDDPMNASRFTMVQEDGPLALATGFRYDNPPVINTLEEVRDVEGSFWLDLPARALYVHAYGHRVPSSEGTGLRMVAARFGYTDLSGNHQVWDGFASHNRISVGGQHVAVLRARVMADGLTSTAGAKGVLVQDARVCHVNGREAPDWDWVSGNTGTGIGLGGTNVHLRRSESFHNWNCGGAVNVRHAVVEHYRVHGAPNHGWLVSSSSGVLASHVVDYNCQDGWYVDCVRDLVVEHATSFGGVLVQDSAQSSGWGMGAVTFRNCILSGGYSNSGSGAGMRDASHQPRVLFENNLLLVAPDQDRVVSHLLHDAAGRTCTAQRYPLPDYLAAAAAGLPDAMTWRGNQVVTSDFGAVLAGGRWTPDTDAWDVHLTGPSSPAVDRGAPAAWAAADLDGDPRPWGPTPDLGADEWTPRSPVLESARIYDNNTRLSWAWEAGVSRYDVQRAASPEGPFLPVGSASGGDGRFNDTAPGIVPGPGTRLRYRIVAVRPGAPDAPSEPFAASPLCDYNGNGRVENLDFLTIQQAWGTRPGQPRWNPLADLNEDGRVDLSDMALFAAWLGWTDSP